MTPTYSIRAALERAARELELSAIALRQGDSEGFAKRAQNEAHAARAALAKEQGKGPSDEELESVARAAEIQDMREQGGLGANDANGIQVQLQRQRLAGLRAVFMLAQDAVFSYLLHRARAALAKHSSPKIDHFLGAISDEQIRDLAEFDFNFDRFNQVDQDKNETLVWECTDTQLIQFARFLIAGGQKP